jgi:hypothetical protein
LIEIVSGDRVARIWGKPAEPEACLVIGHSRGAPANYMGFMIRLHHRLAGQEPTGETQPQAGATPFDE